MGEIGDRVGGFLCAPPPSLIGEHAAMARVGQRFRVDSCGTTDRIFGSAINMAISDFSSLVGRTLKIDMSFASVLCGLTSVGQHTTLG